MRLLAESEILVGLAEVGVVFAGFAGVSVVLGRRNPDAWSDLDAVRLRWMILNSLAASGFALLPLLVHGLGLSKTQTWFTASGLLLTFLLWSAGYVTVMTRRLYQARVQDRLSPAGFVLLILIGLGAMASLISNLASTQPVFGLYLPGLVFTLSVAAVMFLRTLSVLRR